MDEPFTKGIGDYSNYDDNDNVTNIYGIENDGSDTVPLSYIIFAVICFIIIVLGLIGNGVVIWISGFKMKRSVNTTWYLSLAISDFIFCACLPLSLVSMAMNAWLSWLVLCKLFPIVMNINMFSSIFLLVLISVDRCVFVVFPMWSQNHRTVRAASTLVLLAWATSAILSVPKLVFTCENNSHVILQAIILNQFVCGFLIPFTVITVCYTVIFLKLIRNQMIQSSKPFKVMSALIVTFCICWLPLQIVNLLSLYHRNLNPEALEIGLLVSITLAFANSFLNPILYMFMGNGFKPKFKDHVFSKIQNAITEEGRI